MRYTLIPLFSFIILINTSSAQSGANLSLPVVEAAKRIDDITIDGRLEESAWNAAVPTTEFVQREPVEGADPEEKTEVRILYDSKAIYVGARMYDSDPIRIGRQLVRRDEWGQFDHFTFAVDPNNDKRTGYQFRISAAGAQRDAYLYNDDAKDDAWNSVWESGVQIDALGWTAEMRIPLSQIRYDTSEGPQSWGVNFSRKRLGNNETTDFALESRVRRGRVSVYGRLNGLELPIGAKRLEIRPYALTSAKTAPSTPGNPFFDGSELDPRTGLDLRYGLGSSYTLDLTVNPDFGQVEVDPAVVNLSAFEVFFRERRPFFVEDAQIFDFSLSGRSQLFYSRRIGRQPRGGAPSGTDFDEIPTQTNILGAAKVTGRSTNGFSFGALGALTGRESGKAFTQSTNSFQNFIVEPRTQYGVLSMKQDFRTGATQVGAISTLMHRDLPTNGSFDYLTSNTVSLGIDFDHNWGGSRSRDWNLHGFFSGSHVRGATDALLDIQTASNHFFQRPDATRFSVDSTATSMNGYNWRLQFERQSASKLTYGVWLAEVSSGFEVNDVGFSTSGERIDGGFRAQYREITPGRFFRSYRLSGFTYYNFRHAALDDPFTWSSWRESYKSGTFSLGADMEFNNLWELKLDTKATPTRYSDTATRGGPIMQNPGSYSLGIELGTDRRNRLSFRPGLEYENGQKGGYKWETEMEINFRPSPSWEIEISPNFQWRQDSAQYVTRTDALSYTPTFGRRYIFSDLKRRSVSLETRLNVAFTPNLTLQLFAQPLLSSGDYLNYKQLLQPKSFDFDLLDEGTRSFIDPADGNRHLDFDGDGMSDVSFSDRDFNIRSLRMNMVMRWEYRPGSRVFFVWQQRRREREDTGSFSLARDLGNLFGGDAENIFIVKFNYWFGI
jgi:hypothetical protein